MKKLLAVFLVASFALLVASCANYRPLIDSRGVDMNKYEADLRDCQQYAQQVAGPGTQAAVGAGIGAALGYALSRAAGSNYDHGANARVGAVAGAAGGAAHGAESEISVIRRCMSGRGYNVLQ